VDPVEAWNVRVEGAAMGWRLVIVISGLILWHGLEGVAKSLGFVAKERGVNRESTRNKVLRVSVLGVVKRGIVFHPCL